MNEFLTSLDMVLFYFMVLYYGPWAFVGLALYWQRLRSEKRCAS